MAISTEKSKQIQDLRRTQILNAAVELFDQQGYSNTKISDISAKAGISKGLVYHYFSSKEEILFALQDLLKQCVDECAAIVPAIKGIETFGLRLLSFPYYEEVPPLRVYFGAIVKNEINMDDKENPIREDYGRTYFGDLFKRAQEEGDVIEGDPRSFGDIYWKYLLGSLSLFCQKKQITENHPDIDSVLNLFRKKKEGSGS